MSRGPARPLRHDPSLRRLAYRCWPDGCPRGRSCCMALVPEVTGREVRRVDGLMDELARIVPTLREDGGYASVFVEDDGPGYVIESDARGWCPFLVRTRRHALCSIHRLALATGRDVARVKPASCRHWPLVLETVRGRPTLAVHPAAEAMGCVAPRRMLPGHPTVAEAFAAEIAEITAALRAPRR